MIIDIPTVEGGEFIDGGPNTLGTIVRASFLNSLMKSSTATTKEIQTVLSKNGIQPDDRVYDQLFKAISKMVTDKAISVTSTLGDSKELAASQYLANENNKAAKNAQTTANNANDKANQAKQEAYNAQQKADQVPNPLLDQLPIGASSTNYKLISIVDLKKKLNIPPATNIVQTTGGNETNVMSQNAVTRQLLLGEFKNLTGSRIQGATYYNNTDRVKEIWIGYSIKDQSVAYLAVGNGNFQGAQIIQSGASIHSHMYMRIDPGTAYNLYLQKNNPNAVLEIQQWLER